METVKNIFLKWLPAGLLGLVAPVVLWNVWYLNYIDTHGKLIAFLLAPVFAFLGTIPITGFKDIGKSLTGSGPETSTTGQSQFNPFYGWGIVLLSINIGIVLLSNT